MEQNKGYYGKRPLWHWIVLYVVIGVIVYGLIYYFVWDKAGGYRSSYPAASSSSSTQPNSPY